MAGAKPDRARIAWAFPFFGSFFIYLITLAPTVTFWDSGDLISASWLLGISHQPGYPILDMMGRLFSFLPFGNVAYRANGLSAFFSSLSILILYFALIEISDRPALAALAALLPAFTKPLWSQAVDTKPLALNSFFISILFYIWALATRKKIASERYFALSGFLFALGLVNHQYLILYAPALIISWALVPEAGLPARKRIRLIVLSLFFMALGLSVYLYLPIRAAASPVMDLGHPDTYSRFAWTVKWGEYIRSGIPYHNLVQVIRNVNLRSPLVLLGASAALFLTWRALKRDWRIYLPLVVFMLVYVSGITMQTMGGAGDRFGLAAKFYIPAFLMAVPFIYAEGVELAGTSRIWNVLIASVFAAVIVILLLRNFYQNDASHRFFAFDYAKNSLSSAGEAGRPAASGGVLFTWGDNGAFPLWYLHDVEKYRDDAVVIHTPLMTYGWYLRDINRWLGKDIKFANPYYLGENVYRVLRAVEPDRTVAYDYSTVKFLNLNTGTLKARGLVYFEGPTPPGNPWTFYVFRGVDDKKIYKGPMAENIIQIYNYQRQVTGN